MWSWRIAAEILGCITVVVVAVIVFVDLYPDRAVALVVPVVSNSTGRTFEIDGPTDRMLEQVIAVRVLDALRGGRRTYGQVDVNVIGTSPAARNG